MVGGKLKSIPRSVIIRYWHNAILSLYGYLYFERIWEYSLSFNNYVYFVSSFCINLLLMITAVTNKIKYHLIVFTKILFNLDFAEESPVPFVMHMRCISGSHALHQIAFRSFFPHLLGIIWWIRKSPVPFVKHERCMWWAYRRLHNPESAAPFSKVSGSVSEQSRNHLETIWKPSMDILYVSLMFQWWFGVSAVPFVNNLETI